MTKLTSKEIKEFADDVDAVIRQIKNNQFWLIQRFYTMAGRYSLHDWMKVIGKVVPNSPEGYSTESFKWFKLDPIKFVMNHEKGVEIFNAMMDNTQWNFGPEELLRKASSMLSTMLYDNLVSTNDQLEAIKDIINKK